MHCIAIFYAYAQIERRVASLPRPEGGCYNAVACKPLHFPLLPRMPPPSHRESTPASPAPQHPAHAPAGEDVPSLLRHYQRTGDSTALERLVQLHERLLRYLVARYGDSPLAPAEDLLQVARVALVNAVRRFDPARQCSFTTFLVPTVLGEIRKFYRDHTWSLKAPRALRDLALRISRLRDELEARLGRPPTIAEMARAAGVCEERLIQAMDLRTASASLSLGTLIEHPEGEAAVPLADTIGKEDPELQAVEERDRLRRAMDCLLPREREVLQARFYDELSQQEVARQIGLSQMQVSRLERSALARLRNLVMGAES
jgi:RNA polymerase sigma-B factor